MGHIVNARSTRLGWFSTWRDHWFIDKLYYSDYFHYFLRIRFFLVFLLFTKRPWDRSCFIFSHFEIYRYYKQTIISIYVYIGQMELTFFTILREFRRNLPFIHRRRLFRKRMNKINIFFWLFLRIIQFSDRICEKTFRLLQKEKKALKPVSSRRRKFNSDKFKDKVWTTPFFFFWRRDLARREGTHQTFLERIKNSFEGEKVNVRKKRKYIDRRRRFKKIYDKKIFLSKKFFSLHTIFNDLVRSLLTPTLSFRNNPFYNIPYVRYEYLRFVTITYIFKIYGGLYENTSYDSLRNLLLTLMFLKIYSPFFYWYKEYLIYIFKYLTPFINLRIDFLQLENDDVNAIFLSRYIAKKLSQSFTFREVMNPWRREMAQVLINNPIDTLKENLFSEFSNINMKQNDIIRRWKIILICFGAYYAQSYINIKQKCSIFYDPFSLISVYNLLNIYFEDQLVFFWETGFYFNLSHMFTFLLKRFKYEDDFLDEIFLFLHSRNQNKLLIFDQHLGQKYFSAESFRNVGYLYKYALLYKYHFSNYDLISNYTEATNNKIKLRQKKFLNTFIGYKLKMCGRLSRKQRASSYWVSVGNVPLNRYNINIDYAFFTIPLRNSAVTIKIWLARTFDNNTFQLI